MNFSLPLKTFLEEINIRGMYKILYFYYKIARHGPRGYRVAAKKRYGRARCRNSIFVSEFRDGGYTGAACLPPIPRNFKQKIKNSQNLQRSCGISKFLGNLGNSPELPNSPLPRVPKFPTPQSSQIYIGIWERDILKLFWKGIESLSQTEIVSSPYLCNRTTCVNLLY